jgi:hypothetical protein
LCFIFALLDSDLLTRLNSDPDPKHWLNHDPALDPDPGPGILEQEHRNIPLGKNAHFSGPGEASGPSVTTSTYLFKHDISLFFPFFGGHF